jgi:hypothetical protein
MYYYLYKITNSVNNKIYIGVHKTKDLDDNYMGSGRILTSAIQKYGIENFSKEILEYFNTADEMFVREKEIVNDDFILREDTYNLRRGGNGGFDYINKDKDLIKQRNKKVANMRDYTNIVKAIKLAKTKDSYRRNQSAAQKKRYENAPGTFTGKKHNDETKLVISTKAKERLTDPTKNSQFGTTWVTNGEINLKIKKDSQLPKGFTKGRTIKKG